MVFPETNRISIFGFPFRKSSKISIIDFVSFWIAGNLTSIESLWQRVIDRVNKGTNRVDDNHESFEKRLLVLNTEIKQTL